MARLALRCDVDRTRLGETFDVIGAGARGRALASRRGPPPEPLPVASPETESMEAFLTSTGVVALAEIGDKTQLLAIMLAARFQKPAPIIAGIVVATLANHALAASAGELAASWLTPAVLSWVLAVSFLAMAAWTLIPDKADDAQAGGDARGAFVATAIAFFLVEMGDKTQIATAALGARFHDLVAVVAGSTLGMLVANAPAVLLGDALLKRLPLKWVRLAAALAFAALGAAALVAALRAGSA